MSPSTRHLILLRHAETEAARPGHRDLDRRLTATGRTHAAAAGRWLTGRYQVDAVLCSPATRTRETLSELGVGAVAEFPDWLYNGGGDTILAGIRELAKTVRTGLVVGHAPGIPALVHELADPESSDPAAAAAIESRYPAGTVAVLRVDQEWPDLDRASLIAIRLPEDG